MMVSSYITLSTLTPLSLAQLGSSWKEEEGSSSLMEFSLKTLDRIWNEMFNVDGEWPGLFHFRSEISSPQPAF